jgi:hypothetical protein
LADDSAGTVLTVVDAERAWCVDVGDPFRHGAALIGSAALVDFWGNEPIDIAVLPFVCF